MVKRQTEKKLADEQLEDEFVSQDNLTVEDTTDTEPVTESTSVNDPVLTELTQPFELHKKIEKFVATIHSTGDQQMVHALDKINHLMGNLKHSLPAAISLTEDESLKAGLMTLLGLL